MLPLEAAAEEYAVAEAVAEWQAKQQNMKGASEGGEAAANDDEEEVNERNNTCNHIFFYERRVQTGESEKKRWCVFGLTAT